MLQKAVNIAAILGLLLAVLSFGWKIRAHRGTHVEKVSGELSIICSRQGEASHVLQLTVVNIGNVPVYLKDPKLYLAIERQNLVPISFYPCSTKKLPLEPGDSINYELPELKADLLIVVSQLPDGRVWIQIESQRKTLLRLKGAELKIFLIQMVIMNAYVLQPER